MASIFDFLNAVDPNQTMPRDQAGMFEMLQRRYNPPAVYGAPPSPGTMEQMQRALPPPPAPPPSGGQGQLADLGAAAGGQLGMPPQAPQPMPQQGMPGLPQATGFGALDGMHNFVLQNRGALAGLGAALQTGRPAGYGALQGAELDKKRKDEEDQKTREKAFADATQQFIKDPRFKALVGADRTQALKMLQLDLAQTSDAKEWDYKTWRDKVSDSRWDTTNAREQKRFDMEMANAAGPKYSAYDPDKIYLDKNGNRLDLGQGGEGGPLPQKRAEFETNIRKEFSSNPNTKDFNEVDQAYRRIHALASKPDPTGASDIGVVYGLMKMYDPTSVVREGEFATAQNASGVDEKVRAMYNGIISGQKLTPEQRRSFVSAADTVYQSRAGTYEGARKQYEGITKAYGLDPGRVLPSYERFAPPKAEAPKAAGSDGWTTLSGGVRIREVK